MSSDAKLLDAIDARFGGDNAPGRIGVAVSGGSDSLALLHLLVEWGQADIVSSTVDHGLRAEAAGEARRVADICAGLGVSHQTLTWTGWDGAGNLQDQARRARYRLLAEWADLVHADTVALGHTLDDDAETFLMRLAREAGLDGLSGMPPVFWRHGMRFDRPLLTERRDGLRAFLKRREVAWIDDPSNEDEGFGRIKARRAMKELEALGIDPEVIGYSITNLDLARIALGDHIAEISRKIAKTDRGDLIFDRAGLTGQNPEVVRKLIVEGLKWVSGDPYPPRRDAVSDIEIAIHARRNATLHGCLVMVSDMAVRITREHNAIKSLRGPTDAEWDGRWELRGPHEAHLEVRPLGEAVKDCPNWRETGMPRQSLLASPSVWDGSSLVAAPLAGLLGGWEAVTHDRDHFTASLLSR